MRITSVSYRTNCGIGDAFRHIHVGAEANVEPSEKPEAVLSSLRDFVNRELRQVVILESTQEDPLDVALSAIRIAKEQVQKTRKGKR